MVAWRKWNRTTCLVDSEEKIQIYDKKRYNLRFAEKIVNHLRGAVERWKRVAVETFPFVDS